MTLKKKLAALSRVFESVEKQFGQGALIRLEEDIKQPRVSAIPTGSLSLNRALGVGGWPRGRLVEMFGPEGSGKSTMALHAIRECQEKSGIGAYVDAEHALDLGYAQSIGVKLNEVLLSQPSTGEQALEIVDALARSGAVDLIVVDSVAALIPQAELEGSLREVPVGSQARLMSRALRKLVGVIATTSTTVLFLNQLRQKVGATNDYVEVTPGGSALKFFSSVRVDIRRTASIQENHRAVGHRVRARVLKNKVASPFQEAEFDIRYGLGVDTVGECLDVAVSLGQVEQSGAWFRWGDEILGQGKERACQRLKQQPELLKKLRHEIMNSQEFAPTSTCSATPKSSNSERHKSNDSEPPPPDQP